jgi:hypothetical protein
MESQHQTGIIYICDGHPDWLSFCYFQKCSRNSGCRVFMMVCLKLCSHYYILIYTLCKQMKPVGSHGSLSLLFVMKATIWYFLSDSDKVMTYDCNHCHVTSKVLLWCSLCNLIDMCGAGAHPIMQRVKCSASPSHMVFWTRCCSWIEFLSSSCLLFLCVSLLFLFFVFSLCFLFVFPTLV